MFLLITPQFKVYDDGAGSFIWRNDQKLLINVAHIVSIRVGKERVSIEMSNAALYDVPIIEIAGLPTLPAPRVPVEVP